MSLKAGELKTRATKLTNEQSKITGYFNELIAWFGESKKDYKIDTFFGVLREFYEAFSAEGSGRDVEEYSCPRNGSFPAGDGRLELHVGDKEEDPASTSK